MRVAIRTDASVDIGSGHVMRCLALADALRARGAEIGFACRDQEGNLCGLVEDRGYDVRRMPRAADLRSHWSQDAWETAALLKQAEAKPDWLIVDHYQFDRQWERAMRVTGARIMAIDDLADRVHDCEVLLDQNLCRDMQMRYRCKAPKQARMLLGPDFALLRNEFVAARSMRRQRNGRFERMLFFFGGGDSTNETGKALEGLRQFDRPQIAVDVVIGSSNPHRSEIEGLCAKLPNVTLHRQVDNMAELMNAADLAVGAGGITTWERCCLGLPSLTVILSDNQEAQTEAVAEHGACINLGWFERLQAEDYRKALEAVTSEQLIRMEQRGTELVDGEGCDRVADLLVDFDK